MILRPLEPRALVQEKFLSAWDAVQAIQLAPCEGCWMITQPSHAALAADLAAALKSPQFPVPEERIVRSIALHDAGWGVPDAQAIMRSRSVQQHRPQSFLVAHATQFLEAWKTSIETAEKVSPAGGFIVSRHFWRLAEHRVSSQEGRPDRQKLESFLRTEDRRQKKLAAKQSLSDEDLERLTDLLQFCDLLSLYFCCGSRQNVVFPEYFGVALQIKTQGEAYSLDPPLIKKGSAFTVAALRHPATKTESGKEIEIKIGLP